MKSRETCKTCETSKTWKFQCKYGEKWLPDFFYCIFMWHFFEKINILWEIFANKILIVTSLGVKVGMNLKMTPQTIFIAFLCDNFLQNLEFHVFLKQFPAKNIPKNNIIFCETFRKSLARLARLWKVSSCARLARLVKPTPWERRTVETTRRQYSGRQTWHLKNHNEGQSSMSLKSKTCANLQPNFSWRNLLRPIQLPEPLADRSSPIFGIPGHV